MLSCVCHHYSRYFISALNFITCVNPMHKEKVFSIIASSFLTWMLFNLPLLIIAKAQPQGVFVVVKVGDWVEYGNILVTWDSTHMTPNPELIELNNTLWFKNEVLNIIEDTLMIFNQTTQFKNETQKSTVFQLNVYTGKGNDTLMFVPSELNAYDLLYPGSTSPVWINETITHTYAGATREVNHLNITKTQYTEDDPPNIFHFSTNHYWDKETGVLTERFGSGTYINQTTSEVISWTRSDEIVETNLWSPEEKPQNPDITYAIVGVATIAMILIGAWMFWPGKKKLRKRKPRRRR